MSEQFLNNKTVFGTPKDVPVANLLEGSQLGVGYQAKYFDASTPLVFPPAAIIVLQTPQMWKDIPELGYWLKVMMECHAKDVSGIDFSYNLASQGQPVGHDGQEMATPTKATRSAVSPTFVYPEVGGNLIWNFHRRWITDIQNPDTNASMEFLDTPVPYSMSQYAATFMAIQFDPSSHHTMITDAMVYTNVYPQSTTDLGAQRQIGQSKIMERSITYNGYLIHNNQTRELGRTIAAEMDIRRAKYLYAPANVDGIDGKIADAGIGKDIEAILASGGGQSWEA